MRPREFSGENMSDQNPDGYTCCRLRIPAIVIARIGESFRASALIRSLGGKRPPTLHDENRAGRSACSNARIGS